MRTLSPREVQSSWPRLMEVHEHAESECMPSPSPHPSEEPRLFPDSTGLDLTPEKAIPRARVLRETVGRRNGFGFGPGRGEKEPEDWLPPLLASRDPASADRTRGSTCTGAASLSDRGASSHPDLAAPYINSSAPLLKRIHDMKQVGGRSTTLSQTLPGSQNRDPLSMASGGGVVSVLESLSLPQPLKEVNVPRHANRYTKLVSLDIPETTATTSVSKPRRREAARGNPCPNKAEEEEPNIMDLFSPELEWEEASWTMDKTEPLATPLPAPREAAFLMYRAMYPNS